MGVRWTSFHDERLKRCCGGGCAAHPCTVESSTYFTCTCSSIMRASEAQSCTSTSTPTSTHPIRLFSVFTAPGRHDAPSTHITATLLWCHNGYQCEQSGRWMRVSLSPIPHYSHPLRRRRAKGWSIQIDTSSGRGVGLLSWPALMSRSIKRLPTLLYM